MFADVDPTFLKGFVFGTIAATVILILLAKMRLNWSAMAQTRKPLDSFPEAVQPYLTPVGIVRKGSCSCFSCLFLSALLLIVLVITVNIVLNNGNLNAMQLAQWFDLFIKLIFEISRA